MSVVVYSKKISVQTVQQPTNQDQLQKQSNIRGAPGKVQTLLEAIKNTSRNMVQTIEVIGIRIIPKIMSIYLRHMVLRQKIIGRTKTTLESTVIPTLTEAAKTCIILKVYQPQVTNQMSTALIRTHEFLAIFLNQQLRKSMPTIKRLVNIKTLTLGKRSHHLV